MNLLFFGNPDSLSFMILISTKPFGNEVKSSVPPKETGSVVQALVGAPVPAFNNV